MTNKAIYSKETMKSPQLLNFVSLTSLPKRAQEISLSPRVGSGLCQIKERSYRRQYLVNATRCTFDSESPSDAIFHNRPGDLPLNDWETFAQIGGDRAHQSLALSELEENDNYVANSKDIFHAGGGSGFGDNGKDGKGGGDGGEWFRDDSEEPSARQDVLAQHGKTEADIPQDIRGLKASDLNEYLKATRGGLTAWLARLWPGWRRRVAADPEFPFKVLMEETVGLGLTASGMIAAKGRRILAELDFALCDLCVGATMNFLLVYLLTPAFSARANSSLIARLPASLFAEGQYSILARLGGYLYKGALFSGCGFAASIIGTTASQGLVSVRRAIGSAQGEKATDSYPPLPNVFVNSTAWAGFMFVSSSPRYQAVAGLERLLFGFAPETVAKIGSGALRTANNIIGGATWVAWVDAIGLQKTDDGDIIKSNE